jgi:hypothetical protein
MVAMWSLSKCTRKNDEGRAAGGGGDDAGAARGDSGGGVTGDCAWTGVDWETIFGVNRRPLLADGDGGASSASVVADKPGVESEGSNSEIRLRAVFRALRNNICDYNFTLLQWKRKK